MAAATFASMRNRPCNHADDCVLCCIPSDTSKVAAGQRGVREHDGASFVSLHSLQTGEQRQVRHRHKAGTADIHIIGEVTGAVGFGAEPLYCTWQLVYDAQLWAVTKGLEKVSSSCRCHA
jgi:hypothetical protein